MLGRLRLSSKMLLAAAPLVMALVALLTFIVRTNIDGVSEANRAASLGSVWDPLIDALDAVDVEHALDPAATLDDVVAARSATDAAFATLESDVAGVPDGRVLEAGMSEARTSLTDARSALDAGDLAAADEAYSDAELDLIDLGAVLPAEAGDPELGRELQAVSALAETSFHTGELREVIEATVYDGAALDLVAATESFEQASDAIADFQAVAPADWVGLYERRNIPEQTAAAITEIQQLFAVGPDVPAADAARFDMQRFQTPVDSTDALRDILADEVVEEADDRASAIVRQTLLRIAYTSIAILVATFLAFIIARSITRRIRKVSDRANEVATTQLPTLVDALRDPRGKIALPEVTPIEGAGRDEIGELAESFTAVQATLVDVAAEQMEVLRRGVSEIFVTLARRNRSLVDRQLSLLDELEANCEDPDTLGEYYRLDHLATRMRRNAESLLVLANADTRRRRSAPVEIDDVVRAGISEVEEYRRVDVLALESLQVKGPVVADMSHLLAELLDNATSFSPPDSRVRVAGHFTGAGYLITISDRGVGIPAERLAELNELLSTPPVIGLSVEPTLGLQVVSLLAHKHGVKVSLVPSAPGISVNVLVPPTMYEHTTDPSSQDVPFEVTFDRVMSGENADAEPATPGMAASPATPVEDATPATGTPMPQPAEPAVHGEASQPLGDPAPTPTTPAGLPQRRPSVVPGPDRGPDTPVPDFRPAPTTEPHTPAPLATPVPPLEPPTPAPEPAGFGAPPPPAGLEPPAPPSGTGALPTRDPGTSAPNIPDEDARTVTTAEPNQLSSALAAFADGMRAASVGSDTAPSSPTAPDLGLPTRQPGTSYGTADEDSSSVAQTAHDPEGLRSRLAAFHSAIHSRVDHPDRPNTSDDPTAEGNH